MLTAKCRKHKNIKHAYYQRKKHTATTKTISQFKKCKEHKQRKRKVHIKQKQHEFKIITTRHQSPAQDERPTKPITKATYKAKKQQQQQQQQHLQNCMKCALAATTTKKSGQHI